MQLIQENSAKRLLEMTTHLDGNSQWWGLQLNTSKLDPNFYDTHHLKTALNVLYDKCTSYDGTIYSLHNNDIFLILKGMLLKERDLLLKEVQYAFIDDAFSRSEDFYTWFSHTNYHECVLLCQEYTEQNKTKSKDPLAIDDTVNIRNITNIANFSNIASKRKEREKLKILVAEDDMFSRKLTKKALEKNYEVILAANGKEALEKYILHAPDVMFLDIGMPVISGMNVLNNLVGIDQQAFIVMLTSDASSTVVKQAISSGAKGYIIKPFNTEKLSFYLNNYKECSNER